MSQVELNLNAAHANANAMIAQAVADGVLELAEVQAVVAAEAEAPKKKKAKPAEDKPNAAKAKAVKAEAEKVLFKAASGETYELASDADPKALKAEAAEAAKALGAIGKKDADLLKHYLALGGFQSKASKLFKSSKLYGQFLAKELPASQELDAALRSNCKWLWEALNVMGAEGSDILNILGVNRLEDYKSKNPTVIKRDYKAAKEEAERLAAAEELGVSLEELEKEEEAEAAAEKAAADAKIKALIAEFAKAKGQDEKAAKDISDVLIEALTGKKKDAIEALSSLIE